GLEEARELLLRHLDVEVPEALTHEGRILDLLDRPGNPEERLVALTKVSCEGIDIWQPVSPDSPQPGPMPGLDESRIVGEFHERVAQVEEDRFEHGGVGYPDVARRLLWASLVLAPLAIALNYATGVGEVTLFVFSAIALVPLAWLI